MTNVSRHHRVDAMEHYGNRRPRVEKLVSAWNQGSRVDAVATGAVDDPLIGASAEPSKRPRTRLTGEEVDAMRTARAQGVSVNALARRFRVHRGTVWAKTR
jgi:site-specific DNA recombinase